MAQLSLGSSLRTGLGQAQSGGWEARTQQQRVGPRPPVALHAVLSLRPRARKAVSRWGHNCPGPYSFLSGSPRAKPLHFRAREMPGSWPGPHPMRTQGGLLGVKGAGGMPRPERAPSPRRLSPRRAVLGQVARPSWASTVGSSRSLERSGLNEASMRQRMGTSPECPSAGQSPGGSGPDHMCGSLLFASCPQRHIPLSPRQGLAHPGISWTRWGPLRQGQGGVWWTNYLPHREGKRTGKTGTGSRGDTLRSHAGALTLTVPLSTPSQCWPQES